MEHHSEVQGPQKTSVVLGVYLNQIQFRSRNNINLFFEGVTELGAGYIQIKKT